VDTVHECDRQTDGQTELLCNVLPCNAERRTVKLSKRLYFLIGVGAQSTLGGTQFLPEKYVLKISKMSEFYMILARKNIKIPEFL